MYVVQPVPDLKTMNVGFQKRLSFSAIRTKHKASLDMLPFLAEETPFSNTWMNKWGKAVKLTFEMKERKPIINSTTEQF